MVEKINTREQKETPVNPCRKNVNRRRDTDGSIMNKDQTTRKRRYTIEDPPQNAEIAPPRVVGGNVPEIKPVKKLSFVQTKRFIKTVNYNSDYSDVIDTDDEINEV